MSARAGERRQGEIRRRPPTTDTYSLAQSLQERGIRVNSVAPGPVWTPLIPSTFPAEKVEKFGQQVPMARAAQPDEIAPSYVFFAAPQLSSVPAPLGVWRTRPWKPGLLR